MDCPSCGSNKDWAQCADCGGICCDACGYSEIGKDVEIVVALFVKLQEELKLLQNLFPLLEINKIILYVYSYIIFIKTIL